MVPQPQQPAQTTAPLFASPSNPFKNGFAAEAATRPVQPQTNKNPFKVETNGGFGAAHEPFQPVQFNGFGSPMNGFQANGGVNFMSYGVSTSDLIGVGGQWKSVVMMTN